MKSKTRSIYKVRLALVDNDLIFADELAGKIHQTGDAKVKTLCATDFFSPGYYTDHDKFTVIAIDYLSLRALFRDIKTFPEAIKGFQKKNIFILYPPDTSVADLERVPKPENTIHIIKDENMAGVLMAHIHYFMTCKMYKTRLLSFRVALMMLMATLLTIAVSWVISFF